MFRYRTSINFTGKPYSDSISHPKIIESYIFLFDNFLELLKDSLYVIIRLSPDEKEVWMDFISNYEPLLEILEKLPFNTYWNHQFIRGKEYIYEKFLINDIVISQFQHPYSFFQSYKEPRLAIYNYMKSIESRENLVCFGGEFYMYSQIIPHKTLKCFTDCPDLTADALYNSSMFPISHINYNSADLEENIIENPDLIIVNVSRNGLKPRMASTINQMNSDIIYIGCKENIVQRDLAHLSNGRTLVEYLNFSNNVFLFHLKIS